MEGDRSAQKLCRLCATAARTDADHVAPAERGGQSLDLDRRGLLDALILERFQDGRRELHVPKMLDRRRSVLPVDDDVQRLPNLTCRTPCRTTKEGSQRSARTSGREVEDRRAEEAQEERQRADDFERARTSSHSSLLMLRMWEGGRQPVSIAFVYTMPLASSFAEASAFFDCTDACSETVTTRVYKRERRP